jgi:hypothetical protein
MSALVLGVKSAKWPKGNPVFAWVFLTEKIVKIDITFSPFIQHLLQPISFNMNIKIIE